VLNAFHSRWQIQGMLLLLSLHPSATACFAVSHCSLVAILQVTPQLTAVSAQFSVIVTPLLSSCNPLIDMLLLCK
jgi:hypothetical protein